MKKRPGNREDESDTFLRNIENHLPDDAASHPKDLNSRLQHRQNLTKEGVVSYTYWLDRGYESLATNFMHMKDF